MITVILFMTLTAQEYIKNAYMSKFMCASMKEKDFGSSIKSCKIDGATNFNIVGNSSLKLIELPKTGLIFDVTKSGTLISWPKRKINQYFEFIMENNLYYIKNNGKCLEYDPVLNEYNFKKCSENKKQKFKILNEKQLGKMKKKLTTNSQENELGEESKDKTLQNTLNMFARANQEVKDNLENNKVESKADTKEIDNNMNSTHSIFSRSFSYTPKEIADQPLSKNYDHWYFFNNGKEIGGDYYYSNSTTNSRRINMVVCAHYIKLANEDKYICNPLNKEIGKDLSACEIEYASKYTLKIMYNSDVIIENSDNNVIDTTSDNRIILWPFRGRENQLFQFTLFLDDTHLLKNQGECIEYVEDTNTFIKTNCTGKTRQRFTILNDIDFRNLKQTNNSRKKEREELLIKLEKLKEERQKSVKELAKKMAILNENKLSKLPGIFGNNISPLVA